MEILNLDKILPEEKKVILNNVEYIIPGDLPVGIMFKLIATSQRLEKDPTDDKANTEAFELLYDVFRLKNDNITLEQLQKTVTLKQYSALMSMLFGTLSETMPEEKKTEGETPVEAVTKTPE